MNMQPVQGMKQVAYPNPSFRKQLKSQFEEIIAKSTFVSARKACWNLVASQVLGVMFIKASKVFFKTFHLERPVSTIEFEEGNILLLKTYLDALKRDSEFFLNLPEEFSECFSIKLISKETFLEILNFLYGKEYPRKDPANLLAFTLAAHYLNIRKAQNYALELFGKRISRFRTIEDLSRAFIFHKILERVPSVLQESLQDKMGAYFGRMLYLEKDKELLVQRYAAHRIRALAFKKLENLSSTLLALTNLASLRKLTLFKIDKLTEADVKAIPSGLMHLDLIESKCCSNLIKYLPPGLFSLNLTGCRYISEDELLFLPGALNKLYLKNCFLNGFPMIFDQRNITVLDISSNAIGKVKKLPPFLDELIISECTNKGLQTVNPALKKLCIIGKTKITFEAIQRFTALTHLKCSILGQFGYFKNLEELDISFSDNGDDALIELSTALRTLNLRGCCKITNAGIKQLPNGLEKLILRNTQVTDEVIPFLPRGLFELDLMWCDYLTVKNFRYLPRHIRHLHVHTMTNEALKKCPRRLESLNIASSPHVKVEFKRLPRGLRILCIYFNALNDEDASYLPPNLERLDMAHTAISDKGLARLPKSLTFLGVAYCENITATGLANLTANIEELCLNGCENINDSALSSISKRVITLHLLKTAVTSERVKSLFPGAFLIL